MAPCKRSTRRHPISIFVFLLSLICCLIWALAASAQSDYGYRFVRTDEAPADVIYDRVHNCFYVSVPYKNLVYVVSGTDGSVFKTITVQHPLRFNLSADASKLYVGSDSAEGFLTIDTASLSVSDFVRFTVPLGGLVTSTYELTLPLSVAPLSNGKMLISAQTNFMADRRLLMYDPETKTATLRSWGDDSSGDIVRSSSDGTRAVVSHYRGVSLYDSASDSFIASKTLQDATWAATISPDGKKVLVNGHLLFDETLTQIADLHPSDPPLTWYWGSAFSADGTKIYSSLASGGQRIEVYDVATLSRIGYIPVSQPWTYTENVGLAVSDAGTIVYLTEAGFEEYDASARVSTQTTAFEALRLPDLADPASGLQSSPAPTTLTGAGFDSVSFVKFGPSKASNLSVVDSNHLTVQPPPSATPGAVDVVAAFSDGWSAYAPEGYTYGPRILFQDVNAGDVAGGTTITLYGQGLFVGTSKPQITIGGAPVTDLQSVQAGKNYTVPMQSARFVTPPGTKGWADIRVTTPFGSYTVKNGFLYVTRRYIDSLLAIQIVLDESRNRAYVSDAASGDVKSIDLGKGTVSTLISAGDEPASALALRPDSNQLLVISPDAMSLRVFDLNTSRVVNTIHFKFYSDGAGADARIIPIAVVATSSGTALVGATGYVYHVDLGTGNYSWVSPCGSSPLFASALGGHRILISCVLGMDVSATWAWDADYNGLVYGRSTYPVDNLSTNASGDRVWLDTSLYTLDRSGTSATASTVTVPGLMLADDRTASRGSKLHPSGSLLYQPTSKGIEIYDSLGSMRLSIGIPGGVASALDGLAVSRLGDTIIVGERNGVSVITLDRLPLSIGQVSPDRCSPCQSSTIEIMGSGFENGASVTIAGQTVPTEFVDSTKLTFVSPALPQGNLGLTVNLPGGTSYTLPVALDTNPVKQSTAPAITGLSTSYPYTGANTDITVRGTGFAYDSKVYVNGLVFQTAYAGSTKLIAQAFHMPGPGTQQIQVVNVDSGVTSNAMGLDISDAVPFITTLVPPSIAVGSPDLKLNVNSFSNTFSPSSVVLWNGVPLQTDYVSIAQLVADVPAAYLASVGTANVTVTSPYAANTVSNTRVFTIEAPNPKLDVYSGIWFYPTLEGTSSTAKQISIVSSGNVPVQLNNIFLSDSKNFSQTNTCPSSLPLRARCDINIVFRPAIGTPAGDVTATLQIDSNASNGPINIPLSGPAADFAIRAASSSVSVHSGQAANIGLSLLAYGNMDWVVTFECSGLPAGARCSSSPSMPTPSAAGTPVVLTISNLPQIVRSTLPPFVAFAAFAPGMMFAVMKRRRKWITITVFLGICLLVFTGLPSCGGGSGSGGMPPSETKITYPVTVIGHCLETQRTVSVNVIVMK